ncbi:uncharacterized protein METZ01_LOCUS385758, partial [marine metagenome]
AQSIFGVLRPLPSMTSWRQLNGYWRPKV